MSIEIQNLSKSFNKQVVLDNLNLKIESNKIYALLGRNGVGKSTLINLITNRIVPNSGTIKIDNWDSQSKFSQNDLIYCFSDIELFEKTSQIRRILKETEMLNENFNIQKANEYIQKFDLNVKKSYGKLSTGQKSLLKISIALSMDVKYLILDEPILGLDALNRSEFYQELIKYYVESENTIIISTHLIEEISHIVENVIIIKDKKVLLNENTQELLDKSYVISGLKEDVDKYCKQFKVVASEFFGNIYRVYVLNLNSSLEKNDKVTISKCNLQEIFIKLCLKDIKDE